MNINYKSDFSFAIRLADGFPSHGFHGVIYSLVNPSNAYSFSFIDGVFTNCANVDGDIVVSCDNHGLRTGKLVMLFVEDIPDASYPDGFYNKTAYTELGITLTTGASDTGNVVICIGTGGGDSGDGGGGSDTPATPAVGVFIELTDGTLVATADFDGDTMTANSIFVGDGEHSLRVALTDINMFGGEYDDVDQEIITNMAAWTPKGVSGILVPNCTTIENYGSGEEFADFDGVSNTAAIIDHYGATSNIAVYGFRYAADATAGFTFPNGDVNGYLGAQGEWGLVISNKDEINAALVACGGDEIGDTAGTYWTSTQESAGKAYVTSDLVGMYSNDESGYNKNKVRAFAPTTGDEVVSGGTTGGTTSGGTSGGTTSGGTTVIVADYNNLINKPTALSDFENDEGYTKTSVSADGQMSINDTPVTLSYEYLSDTPEIPTVTKASIEGLGIAVPFGNVTGTNGLATVAWVNSQNYLKEHQPIYALSFIAGEFEAGTFTPDGEDKQISIPTKTSHLQNDSGFLTQHQSLNGYATQAWVNNRTWSTSQINDFPMLSISDGVITIGAQSIEPLTEHQSLDEYAKTADVNAQLATKQPAGNYLTAHQSLSGYATEAWVTAKGYLTSTSLNGYATAAWVNSKTWTKSQITDFPTSLSSFNNDINKITMGVTYTNGNTASFNVMTA